MSAKQEQIELFVAEATHSLSSVRRSLDVVALGNADLSGAVVGVARAMGEAATRFELPEMVEFCERVTAELPLVTADGAEDLPQSDRWQPLFESLQAAIDGVALGKAPDAERLTFAIAHLQGDVQSADGNREEMLDASYAEMGLAEFVLGEDPFGEATEGAIAPGSNELLLDELFDDGGDPAPNDLFESDDSVQAFATEEDLFAVRPEAAADLEGLAIAEVDWGATLGEIAEPAGADDTASEVFAASFGEWVAETPAESEDWFGEGFMQGEAPAEDLNTEPSGEISEPFAFDDDFANVLTEDTVVQADEPTGDADFELFTRHQEDGTINGGDLFASSSRAEAELVDLMFNPEVNVDAGEEVTETSEFDALPDFDAVFGDDSTAAAEPAEEFAEILGDLAAEMETGSKVDPEAEEVAETFEFDALPDFEAVFGEEPSAAAEPVEEFSEILGDLVAETETSSEVEPEAEEVAETSEFDALVSFGDIFGEEPIAAAEPVEEFGEILGDLAAETETISEVEPEAEEVAETSNLDALADFGDIFGE
ncbi:MAG: hypothetical protein HC918_01390, partial [Oscillatoriales cyanobacterium SM2_1_8]|nr:hypothetical protein [Oscillatoriales cyanobacterium SM2_1_8]